MQIKPDEITSILKSRIEGLDAGQADLTEVGTVLTIGDGIARIHGLENCMAFEMLELPHDVIGLALNLESDNVGAVLFGPWEKIVEGDTVKRTNRLLEIPVGERLLGRIVSPLGQPLDGKGEINTEETRPAEFKAPGVVQRQPVKEPMQTGIKAIDGDDPDRPRPARADHRRPPDRQDGDRDRHDHQQQGLRRHLGLRRDRPADVDGRRPGEAARGRERARELRSSSPRPADEAAPIKFMAPYAGCAMAEHFLYNGKHTLVVYDDLTKHAYAYRQMSLLLRRPPGREAYPGDVFYLHSRLLERAVKLNDDLGGGSMTALPVIETQAGDVSAYIPTNVISITDGQIFLEPNLFNSGVRPAINVGISVSRVGGNAQISADEEGRRPPEDRALAVPRPRGVRAVRLRPRPGHPAHAGPRRAAGEDAQPGRARPDRGRGPGRGRSTRATNGFLDRINADRVAEFNEGLVERLHADAAETLKKIAEGDWSDETQKALRDSIEQFADDFGYDLDEEGQPLSEEDELRAEEGRKSSQRRGRDRRARRRRRAGRGGGLTPRHGAQGRQEPHRVGQEHPEDHARDGDGRRRAPAPGRAAHRGAAALRGRDPADDAPGGRGGGQRPEPADPQRARVRGHRRDPARHGRPRPRGRVQLADRARRHPRRRRVRERRQVDRLVRLRAPRRVVAGVPRPRGQGRLHRASPTARRTPTRATSPPT